MKYKIVSDGIKFRPMYTKHWYSKWHHFDDYSALEPCYREYDTLAEAELFIKKVIADYIYRTRKWRTVKYVDITALEQALYENKP